MVEPVAHLTGLDIGIIAGYIIIIFTIGVLNRRKVTTNEDFAIAGRSLTSPWIALSAFASWVGLAGTFGTPENVYKFGLSGGWWFLAWLPGVLLMAYLLAGRLRRRKNITIPELILSRSSPAAAVAASLVTSWNYLAWVAVQVFAISTIFSSFAGLNPTIGAIIAFAVMILYTLLGGLKAIVMADLIHAVIIIGIVMVSAPIFAVLQGYSLSVIVLETQEIPNFYTLFKGAGGNTLMVWLLALLPAAFIDPGGLQRVFAAKDPDAARLGLYGSAALYFLFGIALIFLGLVAKVALPAIEAQQAMPALMVHLLPAGLIGVAVMAFLSIAMSTGDSALLVAATTLQNDVYARFRPNTSQKESLTVSRILVILLGVAALLIALKGESVVTLLLLGFSVYVPGLLLPVMAASFDWRLPAWAMLWTIITGSVIAGIWVWIDEPIIPAIAVGLAASAIPFLLGRVLRGNAEDRR